VRIPIREPGGMDETRFTRRINQLVQAQGKDLLRIKGTIDLEGEPRRFVFHGVHMTLDGRPGKPWKPGEPRVNELVIIGRTLDAPALRSDSRRAVQPPQWRRPE
jgi:G3E family GTPase